MPPPAVRLSELAAGALAQFHEARVDADARQQLCALGLSAPCVLRLCQAGEPCVVQVRATRIGLSRNLARSIYVIPHAPDPA